MKYIENKREKSKKIKIQHKSHTVHIYLKEENKTKYDKQLLNVKPFLHKTNFNMCLAQQKSENRESEGKYDI